MQRLYCVTAPISAFSPRLCPPLGSLDTPRMIKCLRQCQRRCGRERHGSPERSVLSDIYVRLSSLRARTRPICRLGCQPSPSSQQVFCAVLCVTVSARLVLGEVADCFGFTRHTALHNKCSNAHAMQKHAWRVCRQHGNLRGHVFILIMWSQTSFTDYNMVLLLQIPWIHVSTITNLAAFRDVSLIPRVALMNACDISEAHFFNAAKPPQPPPPCIIHCVYLLYLMDHCVEIPNTLFCLFVFFAFLLSLFFLLSTY